MIIKQYLIVFFICLFLGCKAQTNDKFKDVSQHGLNVYLWETTHKIWINSFDNRIKELVDRGAEVDYIDEFARPKNTPFLNASGILERLKKQSHYSKEEIEAYETEAVKIVKYLADHGANIHATSTSRKLNALHLAACGGREKVIPVLVELGLDINSRDSTQGFGNTPLLHAIAAGDLATVKAIVDAGADINLCALDGNSPLDCAQAYTRSKEHQGWMPYKDQDAIAEYMESIGAKHGKNSFKGYLYFDESKE